MWAEHGKAAACTVRVTQPYHGGARRLIFADSWFGSIPNALLLFKYDLESICNIKNIRKGFPRKQLFQDAGIEGVDEPDRGITAFWRLHIKPAGGTPKLLYAAVHVDNNPMAMLCTTGRTDLVETVTRKRTYRDALTGQVVPWSGQSTMPQAIKWYRSGFNAVDIFNKLAVGPNSCATLVSQSETHKMFRAFLAMTKTNGFCAYMNKTISSLRTCPTLWGVRIFPDCCLKA